MLQWRNLAQSAAPFAGDFPGAGKAFEEIVHGGDEYISSHPGCDRSPDERAEQFQLNRAVNEHDIAVHAITPRARTTEPTIGAPPKVNSSLLNTYHLGFRHVGGHLIPIFAVREGGSPASLATGDGRTPNRPSPPIQRTEE